MNESLKKAIELIEAKYPDGNIRIIKQYRNNDSIYIEIFDDKLKAPISLSYENNSLIKLPPYNET